MTIERHSAVPGVFSFQMGGKSIFSTVTASRRSKMIFVAGQLSTGRNGEVVGAGDMRAQVRQVCENIKAALKAAGATLEDVVQTSTFVTDWTKFREAIDVRQEYLGNAQPTSTTVQVIALAHPDYMVEISAIAMIE
ncbi:MAG: RidA family protein [Rhodospirillaceae bacterium]|nr:RidA family protein [Rhodospirillaceae bacterium]